MIWLDASKLAMRTADCRGVDDEREQTNTAAALCRIGGNDLIIQITNRVEWA